MTTYNKLVRDYIPDILKKKGIPFEERIAEDHEYRIELFKKLREEIDEFEEEKSIEELADILEVIEAIIGLPEFSDVHEIKEKKRLEKGGFAKRIILKGER